MRLSELPPELEKAKQFHSHLGPYVTVGLRMGQAITQKLGEIPFSFKIKAFTGNAPPVSCIVDGLQLSTPATVGNGGIQIMEAMEPCAVALNNTEQLEVKLRPEVLESIRNCESEAQEKLALQLWTMPEERLFQIKVVHLGK